MKALVTLVFICLASIVTYGQENLIRWHENDPLHWDDFTGKVNDTSWYEAECFAEVGYHYTFANPKDFQFDVFANFLKNISWRKKEYQSETLLKHEQLHFDIAELFSMRMKEMFENYNYTEDFETEIQQLFNKMKLEYQAMQQQYDEETNHSLNKRKQKEWETNIIDQLSGMKMKQQFAMNSVTRAKKGE